MRRGHQQPRSKVGQRSRQRAPTRSVGEPTAHLKPGPAHRSTGNQPKASEHSAGTPTSARRLPLPVLHHPHRRSNHGQRQQHPQRGGSKPAQHPPPSGGCPAGPASERGTAPLSRSPHPYCRCRPAPAAAAAAAASCGGGAGRARVVKQEGQEALKGSEAGMRACSSQLLSPPCPATVLPAAPAGTGRSATALPAAARPPPPLLPPYTPQASTAQPPTGPPQSSLVVGARAQQRLQEGPRKGVCRQPAHLLP